MEPFETGPWYTDNYIASPLNFLPEVRQGMELPKVVKFHDAMLRDGEQTPGMVLLKDHKVAIAKALDEVGVDRIEAGMPAVSQEDFDAIKEIAASGLKAQISAFVRAMAKDIDMCLRAGVKHVVIEAPSGFMRLKYQYGWTEEETLKKAVTAVKYAKSQGLEVCFFPFDSTRADIRFYLQLVKAVYEEAGPDSVTVVDTMGLAMPESIAYLVRKVRSMVDIPVEVHTHNDYGMGIAGSLAGLAAGAEVIHVCINGMGERTGNAALEEVAAAAKVIYNVDTKINFDKLQEASKLVQELSGFYLDKSKPIVGENAYAREVGLGADMIKKQPRTVFPCLPSFVGRKPELVMGKKSGILSVGMKLEDWGLEATEEQKREMTDRVKAMALANRRALNDAEVRSIYEAVVNG